MKVLLRLLLVVLMVVVISALSFAGEKEEREYELAYWQEHIKALQMDFEMSQIKLKEAMTKKQAFDKKAKEEGEKPKEK